MWIADKDGDLINLSFVWSIHIDRCNVVALSNDGEWILANCDTEDQAKNRISQIQQVLRNYGHFVNLD